MSEQLSALKEAYNKEGEDETLIVRDHNVNAKYTAFGISEKENISELFFGLLAVLKANQKKMSKTNFKSDPLKNFLGRLKEEDLAKVESMGVKAGKDEIKLGRVRLRPVLDNYPRIGLILFDAADENFVTGIYLFVSELKKLIKFIHLQYGIGATKYEKFTLAPLDNDDFVNL